MNASATGPAAPWRSVWFAPRLTIRQVLAAERRPSWAPVLLLVLLHMGVLALVPDDDGSVAIRDSLVGVAWAIFELVCHVFVESLLIAGSGRRVAGGGHAKDLRECVVWSYVQFAVTGFLLIPEIVVFGPHAAIEVIAWWTVPLLVGAMAGIAWTILANIIMVAEVHRFSIWRSTVTVVLASIPGFLLDLVATTQPLSS